MFDKFILPLIVGILGGVIVQLITKKRKFAVGTTIIIAVFCFGWFLYLPPYKVTDVHWCLNNDDSVKVTGRLSTLIFGKSVPDCPLRVNLRSVSKIISPFPEADQLVTDIEGRFEERFPPPAPRPKKLYFVNIEYDFPRNFLGKRSDRTEVEKHDPPLCMPSAPVAANSTEKSVKQIAANLALTLTIEEPERNSVIRTQVYNDMHGKYGEELPLGHKLWVMARDPYNYFLVYPPTEVIPSIGEWRQTGIRLSTHGEWWLHICVANEKASKLLRERGKQGDWSGFSELPHGMETVRFVPVRAKPERRLSGENQINIPDVQMIVGERNHSGNIVQKSRFLTGQLVWLDITCSTVTDRIREIQVKWDEHQEGWIKIPENKIEGGDTEKRTQQSNFYSTPGYHTIYCRCLTDDTQSERIPGENTFRIRVEES